METPYYVVFFPNIVLGGVGSGAGVELARACNLPFCCSSPRMYENTFCIDTMGGASHMTCLSLCSGILFIIILTTMGQARLMT